MWHFMPFWDMLSVSTFKLVFVDFYLPQRITKTLRYNNIHVCCIQIYDFFLKKCLTLRYWIISELLYIPVWTWIHRDPSASVSSVLRLKTCVRTHDTDAEIMCGNIPPSQFYNKWFNYNRISLLQNNSI